MADFDQVVLDQERTGTLISNIANLTRNPAAEQYSYADAEARLELLEAYWRTFVDQDFMLQRSAVSRADSPYFKLNKYNEGLSLYLQAKVWFRNHLRSTTSERPLATGAAPTTSGASGSSAQAAFERVRLPRFNGKRRDWEAFKQKFSSLVVDDPTIAPIIKLQHLVNCLEGEAADRLRGIQQNAANFTTAWETLCRRYDNSYLRFKAQMQVLASIPAAKEETESHLSQVLNTVNESINVFRVLKRPVDKWDDLLVYFAESKLPPETRKDWAKEVERKDLADFPTFAQLKEFLEGRLDTLDVVGMEQDSVNSDVVSSNNSAEKSKKNGKRHYFEKRGSSASVHVATQGKPQRKNVSKCTFCKGDHFLSYCQNFARCSGEERLAHVASAGLCYNCLRAGHKLSACTSKHRCFVCSENHHTKLHGTSNTAEAPTVASLTVQENTSVHAVLNRSPQRAATTGTRRVLLSTACVVLQSPSGSRITARALLDSGAEESFVSERVVQALALEKKSVNAVISSIGDNIAISKNRTYAVLKSRYDSNFNLRFSALVLNKLTAALPRQPTNLPDWPELKSLTLADPGLCRPRRIDCILNAEVFAAALRPEIKLGPSGSFVALQSVFGWVLMGAAKNATVSDGTVFHTTVDHDLTEAVNRFWEIEEIPKKLRWTPEEQDCYLHFKNTHRRDEQGRFVVRLPFAKPPVLNDTRIIAERCFSRLERRLQREPKLADAYVAFMDEYINLKHLQIVPDHELNNKSVYYLPHHPVVKSDGSGKIRVVFNASQCDSTGNSLNTFLHKGPKLQEDVLIVLICWAFWRIVFTCDIIKMFRQFRHHAEDLDWLRIIWRFTLNGPIQTARLATVTYGTGCAPFLANACLLQLAEDEAERYPKGAQVLKKGRYVDDFFTGADELHEAIQVRDELTAILATAGMQVGKWASNRAEVLQNSDETAAVNVLKEEEDAVSTLGLCWIPTEDAFCFRIKERPKTEAATKRVILAAIARLFDPVGWLAPFIIRPKILLQDLWVRGVDWDTPVPPDLQQAWNKFSEDMPHLEKIKIPRWFGTLSSSDWELHAFCDASERAYAVALYIVIQTEKGFSSRLMTAKSKVAPLKVISLPRLELCGAGLLANLVEYLLPNFPKPPDRIHCWIDSKVALAWISSHPSRWKTFVANRVSDIHEKLPNATWRHVRSAENPADLATRGLSPEQLQQAEIWWKGPEWLRKPESAWPKEEGASTETNLEVKKIQVYCALSDEDGAELATWFAKFSSFEKLTRVAAYIFRWKVNASLQKKERRRGWLTAYELELGRAAILKVVQAQSYGAEIQEWLKKGAISRSSSICRLSPFVDKQGLLRVGGRLQNAFLSEAEKHPVILPSKHHVVELIVAEAHIVTLHGGPSLVHSFLLRKYWIVRSRNFIRAIVRNCVRCARMRAATVNQQMGPLPAVRTKPARPFSNTGVDYAGPFLIKASRGRGQRCFKGYVAVFICMVVRAVHLEVVSDYTSAAFLAAFKRFVGRRGTPSVVFSDNGTTFKGADAELSRLFAETSAISQEIAAELARDGTEWKYIPPRAPNFGGLWEAGVKAFKYHLKRVVGEQKLTFEEFTTLTASIEACLNSRPISVQSHCEEDVAALTPGHFLIGGALTSPPEPFEPINEENSVCSKWKCVSLMRNHFWKRWQLEFLAQMQQKTKWLQPSRDFKVGDVVLFKDTLMPPTKWPLARIEKLYFGTDGLSRVALIRTASAEYKRPISKLILLPVQEAASSD